MKHHSQWYDDDGTLQKKHLLEIDRSNLASLLEPICKINKNVNGCIELINFAIDNDMFFKLVPQSKIEVEKNINSTIKKGTLLDNHNSLFQHLTNPPPYNWWDKTLYSFICQSSLTDDLLKISECLVQLSEDKIPGIDYTGLFNKFKESGILDYISVEESLTIKKSGIDPEEYYKSQKQNHVTLEKIFYTKMKDNEDKLKMNFFKNMHTFVVNMKSKISGIESDFIDISLTDDIKTIPGIATYRKNSHSTSAEPSEPKQSTKTSKKKSKSFLKRIARFVNPFRKSKSKKDNFTNIGGNYKRNSSRKSTLILSQYNKRKNYKRIK
jgi:hypothetical protein